MKVTKAKGLNAKPLSAFFALGPPGPAGHLETQLQIEATSHSTRPRFALALGPTGQRGEALRGPRRRVRTKGNGPQAFQVARWNAFPQRAERKKGVALRSFALVTFIWTSK